MSTLPICIWVSLTLRSIMFNVANTQKIVDQTHRQINHVTAASLYDFLAYSVSVIPYLIRVLRNHFFLLFYLINLFDEAVITLTSAYKSLIAHIISSFMASNVVLFT